MSTIKYKFENQDDLLFYILNAVGHDFIHDFNNYGRMGKILNYIMGLVQHVSLSEENTRIITSEFSAAVQDLNVQDQNDIQESIQEYRAMGDDIQPTSETMTTPEYEEDTLPPTPSSEPENIKVEDNKETTMTDNPVDESTKDIGIGILQDSQIEENFRSQEIPEIPNTTSSRTSIQETPIREITNRNIRMFNLISSNIPERTTKLTLKKLNIIQRLKDFIQESKFLIISKLQSAIAILSQSRGGFKRNKKQKEGNGINIITRDNIVASIKDIIEEIKETTPQNLQLISYFEYIMYSYLNLSIPGISPLEIFNNSLIEDSASIFIVGQCNNTNIREQAKLCLTSLLSVSSTNQDVTNKDTPSLDKAKGEVNLSKFMARGVMAPRRGIYTSLGRQQGGNKIIVGGALNGQIYEENKSIFEQFDILIESFNRTSLFTNYLNCTLLQNLGNMTFVNQIYLDYQNFITSTSNIQGKNVIELIVGKQMLNVKRTIIKNKHMDVNKGGRNVIKNTQEMVDTITDLIFVKTIDVYNDVKNTLQARSEDSGDGSSITGSAKTSVQRVSKLVASKILELTNASMSRTNSDLNVQIQILNNIAQRDKGYTSADDILIKHFIDTYGSRGGNIFAGVDALGQLSRRIGSCNKNRCRVINNAVPSQVKSQISQIVVCPTSSVCDGMASFGSCVNPKNNREYANMNFSVSYGDESNYYYGQTNIKRDLTSVNISYGISYNNLQIYNFIDVKIDAQPIILQANYVFKNLINRIIEVWKIQNSVSIEDLWRSLYNTDYFLSILKLGSQKAVGDIFQEINSTLFNGGYNVPIQGLDKKDTYGLMGDRPSGVRVFKLLNNVDPGSPPNEGKNFKSSGGYVGGDTTFMYFSQANTSQISSAKKRGGNKITRKHKITNKYYRRRSKQTKRKNKNNRTK